jgi:transposase
MAGKKGQKKRFWSDEEKVSICGQTCAPGVSVAQVARRYAMNTNLIHKWLRDPKFAPDPETIEDEVGEAPCFLPVEIVDRPDAEEPVPALAANTTLELSRFCSGQVLMLSGLSFEGHGAFPAQC